jgi:DNA-binding transcriptional regulator YiaG
MDEKELKSKLQNIYFTDLKKPNIDKFERATIIRDYMQEHKLSIREFARINGFNRSTVEDWLLYNKITPEEYEEKIKEGLRPIDIYRSLRDSKNINTHIEFKSELDRLLTELKNKIKRLREKGLYTVETRFYVGELQNEINRLLIALERQKTEDLRE